MHKYLQILQMSVSRKREKYRTIGIKKNRKTEENLSSDDDVKFNPVDVTKMPTFFAAQNIESAIKNSS